MHTDLLISLTLIVVLGTVAQWIGWRLRIPSILLLLAFGFLAGPVTGMLNPDTTFGELLFPGVSLAVALILFEGGLSLNLRELRKSGGVIFRLVTIGAAVSGGLTAWFAYWLLGFSAEIAVLVGMLLIITGPTVIQPMLRTIRPRGELGRIAKWESILNDPVGAVLAVLMFEVVLLGHFEATPGVIALGLLKTVVVSVVLAGALSFVMIKAVRWKQMPHFLHNSVVLMLVVGAFVGANWVQDEAGLLTVTLLGIVLANQRTFDISHIVEFKENLRVLLISGLFVVLAARVEPVTLRYVAMDSIWFLLALIVVVRPVAVWASTLGSRLDWRERFFLMLLAPRGIVVTAVASVFALKLSHAGSEIGERLLAQMLVVIVGTVLVYGLSAGWVAAKLGLSTFNPQGVLFVGAHAWSRRIALALQERGVSVSLIDYNRRSVINAQKANLPAHCGNVFSETFLEELDLSDVGQVIALTANDEVNAFAEVTLDEYVDRMELYHIAPEAKNQNPYGEGNKFNPVFAEDLTHSKLEKLFRDGAEIEEFTISEEESFEAFSERMGTRVMPMFVLSEEGKLSVFSPRRPPVPKVGNRLLYLLSKNSASLNA